MTKSGSKRHRRRKKSAAPSDLAPVPRRARSGRPSRAGQSPDRETLRVRCRLAGLADTPDNLREARAPWFGCSAGRVLLDAPAADRPALWDAIQHARRVVAGYDAACGAPRRHAVCLRLIAPTDALEADATSPAPDLRSDEARARDAVSAYMRLRGWLGYAAGGDRALTLIVDDLPVTDRPALMRALHCICDGMAGRKMVYRGA